MVLATYIPPVKDFIRQAAERRSSVLFSALYAIFPSGTPSSEIYSTLESACEELAPWSEAIYSVVLAKKDTGLPGDGFFDIFRIHRNDKYKSIAGNAHITELSIDQRTRIVAFERSRVYAHATP